MCPIVLNRSVGKTLAHVSACACYPVICHPSSVTEVRQKVSRTEKREIEATFHTFNFSFRSLPWSKTVQQGRQLFTYLCDQFIPLVVLRFTRFPSMISHDGEMVLS